MNLTRLMVLGTLARHGPRHGHEIRRIAEVTNVGEWGGVSVGALYRELRVMESEGLVEAVRTERVGRRPARTVYAITSEGHLELAMLRERAIRAVHWGQDPLGVALTFAAAGADREELAGWLATRREMYALSAGHLRADRERLQAKGYMDAFSAGNMRRAEMLAEAEVRWHDEFAAVLTGLPPGPEPPPWPQPGGEAASGAQEEGPARSHGSARPERETRREPEARTRRPAPGHASGKVEI